MIPNFYSMGCAQPTGELPCKGYGPATPESSCQTTLPHSHQVKSVTSFSGTNPQQSTSTILEQLFLIHPELFSPPNPANYKHVTLGPLPASPADPPKFSSSHESHWNTVAHWETNGTALSSVVRPEVKPNSRQEITYALLEEMVADAINFNKEKAALAMPPTPLTSTSVLESSETASLRPLTFDLNQTVPDQWQIAPESSPIIRNILDDPEIDDSLPMPSSIHRDSLALPTLVSILPLSLSLSTPQEPAIEEPVSSTSLSTPAQPNVAFVSNMSRALPVVMKAFEPDSHTIGQLSPACVSMSRTHSADNSNGKSVRYRHGIDRVVPLSSCFRHNPSSSSRRRRGTYSIVSKVKKATYMARLRLAAVPNDNSKGKSSRFKRSRLSFLSRTTSRVIARDLPFRLSSQVLCHFNGRTIECVTTPPPSYSYSLRLSCLVGHAIAHVRSRLSSPSCLSINTLTPSVSTGFQVPCFLPEDPPHRRTTPPSTASTLPPFNKSPPPSTVATHSPCNSTFLLPPSNESTLPPFNVSTLPPSLQMFPPTQRSTSLQLSILPPPSTTLPPTLSTLQPSNVINVLPPSNVTDVHQPSNVTLALSSYSTSPPLPTMLLSPLPSHTCHRTSASIGLEALPFFLQRAQLIRDMWPSGATVTCLSHPNRSLIRHARDVQLVQEYLRRTPISIMFMKITCVYYENHLCFINKKSKRIFAISPDIRMNNGQFLEL